MPSEISEVCQFNRVRSPFLVAVVQPVAPLNASVLCCDSGSRSTECIISGIRYLSAATVLVAENVTVTQSGHLVWISSGVSNATMKLNGTFNLQGALSASSDVPALLVNAQSVVIEVSGNVSVSKHLGSLEIGASADVVLLGLIRSPSTSIVAGGNISLLGSAAVNASFLGYSGSSGPGAGSQGTAPGCHDCACSAGGGGGGHGADGGRGWHYAQHVGGMPGRANGNAATPFTFGSGGGMGIPGNAPGYPGGGRILLSAKGKVLISENSVLEADGQRVLTPIPVCYAYVATSGGAGAGGSIWISGSSVEGAGSLFARGGDVIPGVEGAGGAGGRVSVNVLGDTPYANSLTISVRGGIEREPAFPVTRGRTYTGAPGQTGTIHIGGILPTAPRTRRVTVYESCGFGEPSYTVEAGSYPFASASFFFRGLRIPPGMKVTVWSGGYWNNTGRGSKVEFFTDMDCSSPLPNGNTFASVWGDRFVVEEVNTTVPLLPSPCPSPSPAPMPSPEPSPRLCDPNGIVYTSDQGSAWFDVLVDPWLHDAPPTSGFRTCVWVLRRSSNNSATSFTVHSFTTAEKPVTLLILPSNTNEVVRPVDGSHSMCTDAEEVRFFLTYDPSFGVHTQLSLGWHPCELPTPADEANCTAIDISHGLGAMSLLDSRVMVATNCTSFLVDTDIDGEGDTPCGNLPVLLGDQRFYIVRILLGGAGEPLSGECGAEQAPGVIWNATWAQVIAAALHGTPMSLSRAE